MNPWKSRSARHPPAIGCRRRVPGSRALIGWQGDLVAEIRIAGASPSRWRRRRITRFAPPHDRHDGCRGSRCRRPRALREKAGPGLVARACIRMARPSRAAAGCCVVADYPDHWSFPDCGMPMRPVRAGAERLRSSRSTWSHGAAGSSRHRWRCGPFEYTPPAASRSQPSTCNSPGSRSRSSPRSPTTSS